MSKRTLHVPNTFVWNEQRTSAALLLAEGQNKTAVAAACKVSRWTIHAWLWHPDFSAEVDRLSLMAGIASRAERVRIIKRLVRQRVNDEHVESGRDLLDWLKYAKQETDALYLGMAALAAEQ